MFCSVKFWAPNPPFLNTFNFTVETLSKKTHFQWNPFLLNPLANVSKRLIYFKCTSNLNRRAFYLPINRHTPMIQNKRKFPAESVAVGRIKTSKWCCGCWGSSLVVSETNTFSGCWWQCNITQAHCNVKCMVSNRVRKSRSSFSTLAYKSFVEKETRIIAPRCDESSSEFKEQTIRSFRSTPLPVYVIERSSSTQYTDGVEIKIRDVQRD